MKNDIINESNCLFRRRTITIKPVKTFDLNDADVTEKNGCWVSHFPGKTETINIGVMKMEDFVKGTQETVFRYEDGKTTREPIKVDIKKNRNTDRIQ